MSYEPNDDEYWQGWNGELCAGCDLPARVNDLGLCADCHARLERDLIRSRDWEYAGLAFATPDEERENLRLEVIRRYGRDYELIEPPSRAELKAHKAALPAGELPDIPPRQMGSYTEQDVVDVLERILTASPHHTWRELQEVAVILRRYFPDLNFKAFGYKGLRRFVQTHPKRFQTRWDDPKQKRTGILYIRLAKDHTRPSGG
jgi:hypothetical protein